QRGLPEVRQRRAGQEGHRRSGPAGQRRRRMKRRPIFAAAAAAVLLAGCGFQLRKAPDFVFDSIAVNAPSTSPLANELRRSLAADGRVRVLPQGADMAQARVVLDVPTELREKVVVGLNASGQVREFQLRSRIRFRLHTPDGKELIPETELLQQRDISFNETAVL